MANRKLLLADDSITIQKVVNLTFADEGIDVITVGDGNSAMDKLREDMPDLVMADVNMPGLTGYEICEKIKTSNSKDASTPVILLVGSFEPFDEDEANRVGADGYLTKPFQSISQLVEKVAVLLKIDEDEIDETEQTFASKEKATIIEKQMSQSFETETTELNTYADDFSDDEMIQTAQIGTIPIDDSTKLESPNETPDFEPELQFSDGELELEEPDLHKTQPLTSSDYEELAIDESLSQPILETNAISNSEEIEPNNTRKTETGFEIAPANEVELEMAEPSTNSDVLGSSVSPKKFIEEEDSKRILENDENDFSDANLESVRVPDIPMPEAASILELDELNLLDLPPLEKTHKHIVKNGFVKDEESVEKEEIEQESTIEQDHSESLSDSQFAEIAEELDEEISVETVKAVAIKIIERISEKEIRAIAWEVVPEYAELIIKKMAEEKIKD